MNTKSVDFCLLRGPAKIAIDGDVNGVILNSDAIPEHGTTANVSVSFFVSFAKPLKMNIVQTKASATKKVSISKAVITETKPGRIGDEKGVIVTARLFLDGCKFLTVRERRSKKLRSRRAKI